MRKHGNRGLVPPYAQQSAGTIQQCKSHCNRGINFTVGEITCLATYWSTAQQVYQQLLRRHCWFFFFCSLSFHHALKDTQGYPYGAGDHTLKTTQIVAGYTLNNIDKFVQEPTTHRKPGWSFYPSRKYHWQHVTDEAVIAEVREGEDNGERTAAISIVSFWPDDLYEGHFTLGEVGGTGYASGMAACCTGWIFCSWLPADPAAAGPFRV